MIAHLYLKSTLMAVLGLLVSSMSVAGNVFVQTDPQDIPFGGTSQIGPNPSGYDVQTITYTLDALDTLTIEIVPFGVPGDADGDGNPNASSNPSVQDAPGVGTTEIVRVFLACYGPADPPDCVPDAQFIYSNNTLTIVGGAPGSASMAVTATAYVLTIPNISTFKGSLGGTALDFGAFSISTSLTDQQAPDFVPDAGGATTCQQITLQVPVVSKIPFDCDSVNKVKVKDKAGTDKDEIKITKAGFRLDAPNTVDLAVDEVQIRVDGLIFTFPPGSFEQKGTKPDYVFKSATGVKPKVEARLRFDKASWELSVHDGDATLIDNSNGVDVALMVGDFESVQNVTLDAKGKFKRDPKVSCRHVTSDSSDDGVPSLDKMSCISSMTLQHSSGVLVTKSRAGAELVHPNTVFSENATGDLAIVHTSCSACLQCGDVIGNFTIMEIDGLPGDKHAQKCLVPDASCSLLP